MIIKELYVDHFLENDDLTLADLSDQLNVIRVPSQIEAEFLHAFIPSMLYGEEVQDELRVSGSALVEIGSELLELLRVGDGEAEGLHVFGEQGEVSDCPLGEWLQQLTSRTYLSVYTDLLPIPDRLQQWQDSGLIDLFADESPAPAPKAKVDATSLAAETRKLGHRVEQLIRQRNGILVELASGADVREDYLKSRAMVSEAEQRVEQMRSQLQRIHQRVKPIELALQLVKPWHRQTKLTARIEELRALRVRPKDLHRLQRVDRQLSESRTRLRELREQVDNSPEVETKIRRADPEAQRLLEDREEVLRRLHRFEQLDQDLRETSYAEQRDRETIVDAVKQVKETASRLRDARRRFRAATQRARQMTDDDSGQAVVESMPAETEWESVDDIRERIRELKAETHQLLKRRLLPPLIVLALGAVFALGATFLMAALLFDLGGMDTSVGAIGVTGMLASALLKLSFERPPDHQLRVHRERIQQLLREVQERELNESEADDAEDLIQQPLSQSVRPRVIMPGADEIGADETGPPKVDPRIRQQLEEAYQVWVELLSQYDLAAEVAPRDAVAEVRRRYAEQSSLRPDEASTLNLEYEEHRRWLDRYRESVIALLRSRSQQLPHSPIEDATWEELFVLLDAQADSVADPLTTPKVNQPSPQQIAEVQRQIKEMKRSREKILERTGASDADDLQARIERKAKLAELESDLRRVQQRVTRQLTDVDCAADVKRLLDAKSDADLKKQRSRKQTELKRLSIQVDEAQAELESARESVQRLTTDHTKIDLRLQLNLIDGQLVEAAERLRVAQFSRSAVEQLQPVQPAKRRPSGVLKHASRLLQRSRETACHLDYDGERRQFSYEDESGNTFPIREMARNDVELIVMCLQLALVKHLKDDARIRLPVVLEDHSLGYPAEHALQIGRLLRDAASEGMQLFLISCHETVSDLFIQLGVPTLVVERTVTGDVEPEGELEPELYPDDEDLLDSIDEVIEMDEVVDLPAPAEETIERESTDWIPVEYHVADTRDARRARHSDDKDDHDSIRSAGRSAPEAMSSNDLSAKLDDVGRSSVRTPKKFRIDRPHNDWPIRPPMPGRSSISTGDDELPEWWPD